MIWDWVFREGDTTTLAPARSIQTNLVPSGGSAAYVLDGGRLVSLQEQPGRPPSTFPTELDMLVGCQIPPDLALVMDHKHAYMRRGAFGFFAALGTTGFAGDSAP